MGNKSDCEAKREVNFRQVKSWIDEEYKDFQYVGYLIIFTEKIIGTFSESLQLSVLL